MKVPIGMLLCCMKSEALLVAYVMSITFKQTDATNLKRYR
jgi:hypothetical protein